MTKPVSALQPDWSREVKAPGEWNPGKSFLASLRDYQRQQARGGFIGAVMLCWAVLRHRFWSAVSGADIPLKCQIGGGLLLPHPNGVVIHPDAVIGPNCLIFQQVTLGVRGAGGVPSLGGHVDVGAGAKLLGNIVVGDHCVVGANAVLLQSMPANHIAVGVPAVVKPIRSVS
jgi:serine O-acetyltransferase